ncbi:PhzF family phenazine biosynthesis protein [Sphingomonas sp. RP10(2022)]|uniref:PhzF family phenazine biosynthesis protein n=1 Tax=Sphingomonas liriopis TaxID=2949094 RepID=A0A9X2KNM5_9SPHN|nr:PhzF family phenazine biosynthesis protein [Sphingomonas liriopis]MCP3733824.1 PhzF family phenazine biosynthesis protein [Sphingomonas liriopis]
MALRAFQIHAFTSKVFGGNPAGVCLLDTWPTDAVLARIAHDFGPSVTAFVGPGEDTRGLRWFTRGEREVMSFCGHATFAAAHAVLHETGADAIQFATVSGIRPAAMVDGGISMGIPCWSYTQAGSPAQLGPALRAMPVSVHRSERDWIALFETPEQVAALAPDYDVMRAFGDSAVIATALAGTDVVFRFFCPGFSIGEQEDPATGSAISALAPFWNARLGQASLDFIQVSSRGGAFRATLAGDALTLVSKCVTFSRGWLDLPDPAAT